MALLPFDRTCHRLSYRVIAKRIAISDFESGNIVGYLTYH